MGRYLLALAMCLASFLSFAQHSPFATRIPFTYVFKLDSAQVVWIQKNGIKDTSFLFTHKQDSFRGSIPILPSGNYIFASYQNGSLSAYVHVVPLYTPQIVSFNDLVHIRFLDSTYRFRKDIDLWVNHQKQQLDSACNCYELPRNKKDRPFYITDGSYFMFGKIEGDVKHYPNPPLYNYGQSNPIISHGYFLLNQQKFHPKDTLKLKAYILNAQGIAFTKPLKLFLENAFDNKRTLLAMVPAQTRGAYVYEFKLMDTLKIDHMYRLVFEAKDGSRLQQTTFTIQEYKLRNSKYDAYIEKTKVYKGEQAMFILSAKDANDLPIPGTRARVRIKLQRYSQFAGKTLFVPNSWLQNLYETYVELDISKQTEVLIPKEVMPQMNLDVLAEISFSDASGELKQLEIPFSYTLDSSYYMLRANEQGVIGLLVENGKVKSQRGILKGYLNSRLVQTDTLLLPFQKGLSSNINRFELVDTLGKTLANVGIPHEMFRPAFYGERTHDSIQLSLYNPGTYEVFYRVYRDNMLVFKGCGTNFYYAKRDTGMGSYNVIFGYTQLGTAVLDEAIFTFKEKLFTVKTNLPDVIYPGQTLPLDIQVFSYERKPKAGVNLTAFGVNAQFDDYQDPYLKYYGEDKDRILMKDAGSISQWPYSRVGYTLPNMKYTTLLQAGMITMEEYRLRYPNEQMFVYVQKNNMPGIDFTPFAVGNGKRLEIYAIEIDEVPSYVKGIGSNPGLFSFKISQGNHQIRLRTSTAWYEIPSFYFGDSTRVVFSFDTLCLPNGIVKTPCENKMSFSAQELERISKHILSFSKRNFCQYKRQVLLVQNNVQQDIEQPLFAEYNQNSQQTDFYYGPFAHDTILVIVEGKIVQKIRFEPDKRWVFFRERIIQEDMDSLDIPFEFRYFRHFDPDFFKANDTLPHVMKFENNIQMSSGKFEKPLENKLKPACFFGYQYQAQSGKNDALTLVSISNIINTQSIAAYFFHVHDARKSLLIPQLDIGAHDLNYFLDTGAYDMYVVSRFNKLYKNKILVQPNGTLLIRLDSLYFTSECAELQKMIETAKMLDVLEEMQNRGIVSYRKEDYVKVKVGTEMSFNKGVDKHPVLSGYVFDALGHVLENVIVTLEQEGVVKGIGFSDVSGGFLIRDVVAGTYSLRLTRYGSCVTIIEKVQLRPYHMQDLSIQMQDCGFATIGGNIAPTLFFGEAHISKEIKSQYENTAEPIENGFGMIKGKVIDAETKRPMDFVSITVKRNGVSVATTLTDDDGVFVVKNIKPGEIDLYAAYLGYKNLILRQVRIEPDEIRFINFSMEESYGTQLQEVTVTYKKQMIDKAGVKGSVSQSNELMYVGTRNINALASTTFGVESRSGDYPNFRGSRSNDAAYYIDGVRVNTVGSNVPQNAIDNMTIDLKVGKIDKLEIGQRARLTQMSNDPNVKSNRTSFRDYAFWVPNLVTNKYGEAHVTITFPDNITRWRNFILAMDESFNTAVYRKDVRSYKPLSASLFIPSFLVKGDSVSITGKVSNYTGDSFMLETRFNVKDSSYLRTQAWVKQFTRNQMGLVAKKLDTLQLGYSLKTDFGYEDGERFLLPVLDNGVLVNSFTYFNLKGDTLIQLPPLTNGVYSLKIMNGYHQLIKDEIKRLQQYRYGCVEQTTSKLSALLVEMKLSRLLNDTFMGRDQIITCIKRLEGMQLSNGSWGWYTHSQPEVWLTHYVLQTLQAASLAGFTSKSLPKGVKFFRSEISRFSVSDKLRALEILFAAREDFPYPQFLETINETDLNHADRLLITFIKQKMELPHFSGFLLEGIQKSKEGAIYWQYPNRSIYQNQATTTLLAYQVLKADMADSALLAGIRKYFFNEVVFGSNQYRNTLESAKVLQAMATDLSMQSNQKLSTEIELNGTPLTKNYPQEIPLTNGVNYQLKKSGAEAMVFLSRKYTDTNPPLNFTRFKIQSSFLQDARVSDTLQALLPVMFKVAIEVKAATEFVMVQIPIPASCNYLDRNNRYGADEVEYHKDRIILFYRKMYPGTKTLDIQLEPRFSGNFTLLPVQVENMYNPMEAGNNLTRKILVKP